MDDDNSVVGKTQFQSDDDEGRKVHQFRPLQVTDIFLRDFKGNIQ